VPHVCLIALENRGYSQVVGNSGPQGFQTVNSLLKTYGYASNFSAFAHPSLPNYLALACGFDDGVQGDGYNPSGSNALSGNTFVDSLANAQIGWKAYCENIPSQGYLGGNSGGYAQRHNPWVYFASVRNSASQRNNIVPYGQLATDLKNGTAPPFIWITPNLQNSGHDGTDATCDNYVNTVVPLIQSSTWYTNNHGKIILWWDEAQDADTSGIGDNSSTPAYPHGGHVLLVVISAANNGTIYSGAANHLGLLHALEKLYGVRYLLKSANAANGDVSALLG
jgi:acid phosphatase